ncbi:hypothetical protein HK100_000337 [Physocladia obscura]|uniref:C2H2-type domain-containing protein n=1 Tax=Physocladia obscura TaxID=109957 RepID=A0AAD5T1A2_9FUNG|nr:hypothetical protein HK100_000337 [Physocladia obscura]
MHNQNNTGLSKPITNAKTNANTTRTVLIRNHFASASASIAAKSALHLSVAPAANPLFPPNKQTSTAATASATTRSLSSNIRTGLIRTISAGNLKATDAKPPRVPRPSVPNVVPKASQHTLTPPQYSDISRKEFRSFVFYFEGIKAASKKSYEQIVIELNASMAFLFKKDSVTHLVISDAALLVEPDPNARASTLTSTAKSEIATGILFARKWNFAIWPESEFLYHTSRLRKPAPTKNLQTVYNAEKAAIKSVATGASLNLAGFRPLKGLYILVEDLQQQYRTIGWKDFNPEVNTAVNGDGESVVDSLAPIYPILYLEGKGKKFVGNAFTKADAMNQNIGVGNVGNGDNLIGESDEESDDEEDDEEEGEGGTDVVEGDNDTNEDMIMGEKMHEQVENIPESGYQLTVSAASGINNTTSMRPQQDPLAMNKYLSGLINRTYPRNGPTTAATQNNIAKVENIVECVKQGRGIIKQKTKAQKRSGPKGKDFYFRPGYCENCAEKYDSFIKHVASARHQQWATENTNFGIIDKFLSTVHREVSQIPRPLKRLHKSIKTTTAKSSKMEDIATAKATAHTFVDLKLSPINNPCQQNGNVTEISPNNIPSIQEIIKEQNNDENGDSNEPEPENENESELATETKYEYEDSILQTPISKPMTKLYSIKMNHSSNQSNKLKNSDANNVNKPRYAEFTTTEVILPSAAMDAWGSNDYEIDAAENDMHKNADRTAENAVLCVEKNRQEEIVVFDEKAIDKAHQIAVALLISEGESEKTEHDKSMFGGNDTQNEPDASHQDIGHQSSTTFIVVDETSSQETVPMECEENSFAAHPAEDLGQDTETIVLASTDVEMQKNFATEDTPLVTVVTTTTDEQVQKTLAHTHEENTLELMDCDTLLSVSTITLDESSRAFEANVVAGQAPEQFSTPRPKKDSKASQLTVCNPSRTGFRSLKPTENPFYVEPIPSVPTPSTRNRQSTPTWDYLLGWLVCPIHGCSKEFYTQAEVRNHIKTNHYVFACPESQCLDMFPNISMLGNHIRDTHPGRHTAPIKLRCKIETCQELDDNESLEYLVMHLRESHGIVMCDLDGNLFKSQLGLKKHLKAFHGIYGNALYLWNCPDSALAFSSYSLGISFQSGNNGAVMWSMACDWSGGDIANVLDTGANCGLDCVNYSGCTHFSWTEYNGGTCWLKNSNVGAAISSSQTNAMCGYVTGSGSTSPANILISGSGSGTYYYDITGRTCNGAPPYPEDNGYTFCEPDSGYETLTQRGDNYIVALALDQMQANKAGLCGKQVIVKYNGNVVPGNFVVWDACQACTGGVRLDFSVTALLSINSNACQLGVVPGVSWEVTTTQVIPYVP